jgi:tetratricopeptide (TPR) repeat protein
MQTLIKTENFYEILGIDINVTENEIKKAYFSKVREYPNETHPEEFQLITKAYNTLKDSVSRKQYNLEINNDGAYTKLLDKVTELINNENYNIAIVKLNEMLSTYSDDFTVQERIAYCYFNLEKYEESKKILLKLESQYPNNENVFEALGEVYLRLKMYNQAKVYYRKLVSINTNEANYLISLATCHFHLREYDSAISVIEEKLKQNKETVYDFPLYEQLFFITMVANKQYEHKNVIARIKKLPANSEEKLILLRMLISSIEDISNENNGYKELVHLVTQLNSNEFKEVNEWIKVAESYIRTDLIYYGDTTPITNTTNNNNYTNQSTSTVDYDDGRGSIFFSIILGIITSFFLTPIGGIIVGFIWYFNAPALKRGLAYLGCFAVVIVIIGIMILSNL